MSILYYNSLKHHTVVKTNEHTNEDQFYSHRLEYEQATDYGNKDNNIIITAKILITEYFCDSLLALALNGGGVSASVVDADEIARPNAAAAAVSLVLLLLLQSASVPLLMLLMLLVIDPLLLLLVVLLKVSIWRSCCFAAVAAVSQLQSASTDRTPQSHC